MPVIHVRTTQLDRDRPAEILAETARAVADAVPCDLEGVWCTFTPVDVQTVGAQVREAAGRIVYVDVWIRPRLGDEEAAARALSAACAAIASGFGVPLEDLWGTLRPVEPNRVFAGGSLIDT